MFDLPILLLIAGAFAWTVWHIVAYFSGWHELATRFPRTGQLVGRAWRFQRVAMHFHSEANYGGVVTVLADETGLGLSMPLPFRIGHPPLFIPWSATMVCEVARLRFF